MIMKGKEKNDKQTAGKGGSMLVGLGGGDGTWYRLPGEEGGATRILSTLSFARLS